MLKDKMEQWTIFHLVVMFTFCGAWWNRPCAIVAMRFTTTFVSILTKQSSKLLNEITVRRFFLWWRPTVCKVHCKWWPMGIIMRKPAIWVYNHVTLITACSAIDFIYTDPKWKLYIVFKNIYFDDKLNFGVNFFGHRIFNALSMSLKNLLDEKHKLHIFMNNSVQRGQNENF